MYCAKLTPWNTAPFEKLMVVRTVKKFPTFYGTLRFITLFTRAHQSYSCIVIILTKQRGSYSSCVSRHSEGVRVVWVLCPPNAAVSMCCLNTHSIVRIDNLPGPRYACGDKCVVILTQEHSTCKFQKLIKNYISNPS